MKKEIGAKQRLKDERFVRGEQYARLAREACIQSAIDADGFLANCSAIEAERGAIDGQRADLQNIHTEKSVLLSGLKKQHDEIESEIKSLRNRKSNIPARISGFVKIFAVRCSSKRVIFRSSASWWRYARRNKHGRELPSGCCTTTLYRFSFRMSATPRWPDGSTARISVIASSTIVSAIDVPPRSLAFILSRSSASLRFGADSGFYAWIEADLASVSINACCETFEAFRREAKALTRAGQIKSGGERHEKDDRYRLDDRTR